MVKPGIYWSSKVGKYPGVRTRIAKLLKSQKNKCASCGLNFRPTDIIEVDHIVPRSVGGKDTYENIQLLLGLRNSEGLSITREEANKSHNKLIRDRGVVKLHKTCWSKLSLHLNSSQNLRIS